MSMMEDGLFPNRAKDQISAIQRMRDEGTKWRNQWGANWDRNVAIVRGDLWPDKAAKPQFLANLISPAVRRKAGLLVESKPGIDIRPRKSGLQATADVLKKTATAILDEQNAQSIWETLSYFLAAFGCGFVKVTYDPHADFGLGSIVIRPVDPRLMCVDPNFTQAVDLWDCSYMIESCLVDWAWVRKRFPRTSKDIVPNADVALETNETHQLSWYDRQLDRLKKLANKTDAAVPRVMLQQAWVKDMREDEDGNLIYPGGRRIFITSDDVILNPSDDPDDDIYGQANPHWDGLWPYVMLDNEPDLDHPFGHPEAEALRKMNEAFNAVGHNVVKTLVKNIGWVIADRGAIETETLQDLKDLEEMVIESAPGRKVDRVPPPQPTTTNIQFMTLIQALIDVYSGLSDGGAAAGGKGRSEVRSGTQLEGLQQAGQVLIRAQARRFEMCIERVGTLLNSRIFQYMTDDRILVYVDDGQVKTFDFQKQQLTQEIKRLAEQEEETRAQDEMQDRLAEGMTLEESIVQPEVTPEKIAQKTRGAWKLFRFKVLPFSTLASTKVQRAAILEQLAEQMAIPQSMVVQEAGFENWQELLQEALQEMAMKQQLMKKFGVEPPPPSGGAKKKPGQKK